MALGLGTGGDSCGEARWDDRRRGHGTSPSTPGSRATIEKGDRITAVVWREARLAGRSLRRNPGFSALAVVTLGLGIGATTAVFSLVHGVVLRPLPYPESHRLVALRHAAPGIGIADLNQTPAMYLQYRARGATLDELGLYRVLPVNVAGEGHPERVESALFTASMFSVLGTPAQLGRVYDERDDVRGGPDVALISHGLWHRRFGADPAIVGRSIDVAGQPVEIIGVMPSSFAFPTTETDLWMPMRLDPAMSRLGSFSFEGIGRLRGGTTADAAERDLTRILHTIPEVYPQAVSAAMLDDTGMAPRVVSLKAYEIGDMGRTLWTLLGSVGLVLIIACANVINLFLVRADARRGEVAIRTALGASRTRLLAQFAAESVTFAIFGGLLGCAIAWTGIRVLVALGPDNIPRLHEIGIDAEVILFACVVAGLASLSFSAFSPVHAKTMDVTGALRDGIRTSTAGRGRFRSRQLLAMSQIALAMVLLVGSGLMIRSFLHLRNVDPGFDPHNVLTFRISLNGIDYADAASAAQLHQRLLDRVAAIPGVVTTGMVRCLPLTGWCGGDPLQIEETVTGRELPSDPIAIKPASPGYFQAMGIEVLEGRPFDVRDNEQRTGVALVSRALARRFWPETSAIGKRVYTGGRRDDPQWFTIVGVTRDIHMSGLTEDPGEVLYRPLLSAPGQAQSGLDDMSVVVRTTGSPLVLVEPIRAAIRTLDPRVPIADVRTLDQIFDGATSQSGFAMIVLAIAATLAMVLGAVGIYGVISYVVGQRRGEIGVRMALGASPRAVSRLALQQAGTVALAGVIAGALGAVAVTRVMGAMLYGVSALDPSTYVGVAVVLLAVTSVASYLPARRAATVNPVDALRAD